MHVTFNSGRHRLEGILEPVAGAQRAAVVCHPHPQYGGNMFSNVVRAVHDALSTVGYSTLRFNFRGVGESEGVYSGGRGERDDAAAAIEFLSQQSDARDITLAGYSFGAMVAVELAPQQPAVHRLVAVAPPLAFFSLSGLSTYQAPTLLVVGDRDEYCDSSRFRDEVALLNGPVTDTVIPGADHFFFGHEPELRRVVADFAR